MARLRTKLDIDLIGFLDIVSVLIVIILLVISSMAINLADSSQAEKKPENESNNNPILPTVKVVTAGGAPVTSSVTFLMCDDKNIVSFNPQTGKQMFTLSQGDPNLKQKMILEITTVRAYLAVKPSCFSHYQKLAMAIEGLGTSVGYEPIEETSPKPWSLDKIEQ